MTDFGTTERAAATMPLSQRKIEANRQNSLRSTGPTSPQGKNAAKGNALKYGLCSTQIVLERVDGEDAQEKFDALHESLRVHFAPTDPIAEFRVKRVAENMWRLRRNDRAEAAIVEQQHLRAEQEDFLRNSPTTSGGNIEPSTAGTTTARKQIRLLIDRLVELETEITREGSLSAESQHDVVRLFGTFDEFTVACLTFCVTANGTDGKTAGNTDGLTSALVTAMWEQAQTLIAKKRQQLSELEEALQRSDEMLRATVLSTLCIPAAADLDRLSRSRAAINKELEGDLACLKNLPARGQKGVSNQD